MATLIPPHLSAFDPSEGGDGSIDPLGLLPLYERLADRMLPAVTVRMGRPRFITALAVGAHVCAEFDPDEVAADGVTPPYLVFEWWVIESFVRAREHLAETKGIPGLQKLEGAKRAGRTITASAYLKTPGVFGFTGVFRRFARHARVLTHTGRLDDAGHRLLDAWARDRGLAGFLFGRTGCGATFRDELRKAVSEGIRKGQTVHRPAAFWESIAKHLDPSRPGRHERKVLLELIRNRSGEASEVQAIADLLTAQGRPIEFPEEKAILRQLRARAPENLARTLGSIESWEALCRPLSDAFDWIRWLAGEAGATGVTSETYARSAPTKNLARRIGSALESVARDPVIASLWSEGADVLPNLREARDPNRLFDVVLQHHREIQRRKPPNGKRPWVEDGGRGRILVRPSYALDEAPSGGDSYVHEYRLPTYSRFLRDLGAFAR